MSDEYGASSIHRGIQAEGGWAADKQRPAVEPDCAGGGITPSNLRAWRNKIDGGHAGSPQRAKAQVAIPQAVMDLAAETPGFGARTKVCAWGGRF